VRYSDAGAEAYARRALMPAPGPARRRPPPRRSTRRLLARAGREDRRPACGARRRAEPGGVRSAVRRARPGARATRRSVLGLHARRGWRSLRRACPSPTSARLQHGAPICWRSGTRPAAAISTPATCAANSTREVWWLCATCGQEWQRSPSHSRRRAIGKGLRAVRASRLLGVACRQRAAGRSRQPRDKPRAWLDSGLGHRACRRSA
jgi:hypothetical protein